MKVGWVSKAKIALGRHMETDWLGDCRRQVSLQQPVGEFFMLSVHAVIGNIFAFVMQQMADIMQQSRDRQLLGTVRLARKESRLQAVLQHRDRFTKVRFSAITNHQL